MAKANGSSQEALTLLLFDNLEVAKRERVV